MLLIIHQPYIKSNNLYKFLKENQLMQWKKMKEQYELLKLTKIETAENGTLLRT